MKSIRIIISVVMIVFALYLVGSSISNLQNIDEKYDAETQELTTELDLLFNKQLDLCTTTDHLGDLKGCKSESIPKMIETCNDPATSNLSICADARLKLFSNTIDRRIETASNDFSNKMNAINSEIDTKQFELLEHCSDPQINLDFCKKSILDMKNSCAEEGLTNLPSCNDPRIEEILNRVSLQSDDVIENSDNQTIYFLTSCTLTKTKQCVDNANKMIALCNIDASGQACDDPRLKEIANYDVQSIQDLEITNPEITNPEITNPEITNPEITNPEITPEENNLLATLALVSIPSEELLEICTNPHVLDETFKQLRMQCNSAMNMMMDIYCSNHGQYTETLCIDNRVDAFYGREPQSQNIPDTTEIKNINENISMNSLNFKITSVDGAMEPDSAFFVVFIHLELENTGNDTLYVSKNNFQIIDVKGNIINANSFARSPQDPIDFKDFAEINQLTPNQKINDIVIAGMTRIPQGSILKITFENMERFVKLID